jgi:hypothetical protein
MRRSLLALGFLALFLASPAVFADEGMWLYNAFPKDKVKSQYGFAPTRQWLDHLRLSSVRFNNGGSGSFVSGDGLTFTNHHVGAECIQQLTTSDHDYMATGFYAKTREAEAKCPDLELNQLVGIEDVTARVASAAKPGISDAEAAQAQRAAIASIEQQCTQSTALRCDVVTLYSGAVYNLYKYKKYTDVRLVFAPEYDIASFGGDPDNFTYPRYDLDFAFFRVYENGEPVHPKEHLRWSSAGVKDGDLVFVSGHPGTTGRLLTIAQLGFLRDVDYATRLDIYRGTLAVLHRFAGQSPENARLVTEEVQAFENSFKVVNGLDTALMDKNLLAGKAAEEEKLRAGYKARNPGGPDPWEEIANAMQAERQIYYRLVFLEYNPKLRSLERMRGFNCDLCRLARLLVRAAEERPKPNAERLPEYQDSYLPSLEQQIFSTAPIHKTLETIKLAESLREMQAALGAEDSDVLEVLNGKTPDEIAKFLVERTTLDDVAVRKQLYEGGQKAIENSKDPLVTIMRALNPSARKARDRYDNEVQSVEHRAGAVIAKVRFAETGFTQSPDATFTLRLGYGAVQGYTENGKPIPYATTMGGAFQHAAEHGNQPPYKLPESWMQARSKLNPQTPFNFVSTADSTGGNSGSPTVNKAGEVVGILFDGNMQSLIWDFAYDDKVGRSVHVDSRAIQEALRKIYGANALADELSGSRTAKIKDGKRAGTRRATDSQP